jgi:hypothetical protein
MKTTLKTLTALGLICLALNAVQAQEIQKKCDCDPVAEDYFSKGYQKSLVNAMETDIPTYAFNLGLKTMESEIEDLLIRIRQKIKETNDSLGEHERAKSKKDTKMISRRIGLNEDIALDPASAWLSMTNHLTEGERKTFFGLLMSGLSRSRPYLPEHTINSSLRFNEAERKVFFGLLKTGLERWLTVRLPHESGVSHVS